MTKRTGHILKAAFIVLLLAGVCTAFAGTKDAATPAVRSAGTLDVIDGVTVVSLFGTPEEIGRQHGELLGKRLPETAAAFQKIMPPIPGGAIGRWFVRQFVMFQVSRMEKYLEDDEIAELKGMESTHPEGKGDYRELLYYHVLQDIGQNYACTGAASAGSASMLDGPVAGRNFDLDMRGVLEPLKTVFYVRPDDGPAYVSVAWPGMMGAVSGMNEHGLCVMEFSAKSGGTSLTGVPVAFMANRVLAKAKDIDQAIGIIKATPRMGPNIFLLADKTRAAAVEFDSKNIGVREISNGHLPVANHFFTAGLIKDEKNIEHARYSDSRTRYGSMKSRLEASGRVGVVEMLAALRGHEDADGRPMAWGDFSAVNNVKDAHSVIFDPAGMRFWVGTKPQAYGGFIGFRLGHDGLEKADALPPDPYIGSEAGKRALESDALLQSALAAKDSDVPDGARGLAERALKADPKNYLAALFLGDLCMEEDSYGLANAYYERAVKNAPAGSISLAMALAGRGDAFRLGGMPEKAKADYDAALSMDCSLEANETAERGLSRL